MAVVFFDYDGVLADSLPVEGAQVPSFCKKYGITQIQNAADLAKFCEGDFYKSCAAAGIDSKALALAYADFDQWLDAHEEAVSVHRDIADLISEIGAMHPVYFATANSAYRVEHTIKRCHIKNVKAVMGYDESPNKVEKYRKVRQRYPQETFYFITDSKGDILEAKESDIDVIIGVSWGWHSRETLAAAKPHHLFDTAEELRAFLSTIF